ncbi:hypothetical protein PENTCL1PPCAC_5524, partial [Pristionchus entomophagus]
FPSLSLFTPRMNRFHLMSDSQPFSNIPFYIPMVYKDYSPVNGRYGHLGIIRRFDSPGKDSVMIKQYRRPFQSGLREAQLVRRELNLLRNVHHQNIVRLLGYYSVNEEIYYVTEYCGRPLRLTIDQGLYSLDQVKKWMRELLGAVQYLHALHVIHRNLNSENICIDSNNKLSLLALGKARVVEGDASKSMTKLTGRDPYMPIELCVDWDGSYDEKDRLSRHDRP